MPCARHSASTGTQHDSTPATRMSGKVAGATQVAEQYFMRCSDAARHLRSSSLLQLCLFFFMNTPFLTISRERPARSAKLWNGPFPVEIHTGKIHMYFVTSVLYEITCITSNTDKQDADSNPGVGRICYTMHPPARNSRSQTGTPGVSRTQSVVGDKYRSTSI